MCRQKKKGIRKGCLFTILSVGDDAVRFENVDASFTFDQIKQWLRLSFATTYASCQGSECIGTLRLWDVGHMFYTRRHLFVSLSRSQGSAFIELSS